MTKLVSSDWIAELVISRTKISGIRITKLINGISWHDPSVNNRGWRFRSIILLIICMSKCRATHWMNYVTLVGGFEVRCLLIRRLGRFHIEIIKEVVSILRVVTARTLAFIALAGLLTLA